MVSRRRQVNRTRRIRKRNRFLWIAAEGDNKTERLYFNHLNREQYLMRIPENRGKI